MNTPIPPTIPGTADLKAATIGIVNWGSFIPEITNSMIGGNNGNVQYNDNGNFAGSDSFTYDNSVQNIPQGFPVSGMVTLGDGQPSFIPGILNFGAISGVNAPTGSDSPGGGFALISGSGDTTGSGGILGIFGGNSGTTAGVGGAIFITAGNSASSHGGPITIATGSATVGSGGQLALTAGDGSLTGGDIMITTGSGTSGGSGQVILKTPDSAGNVDTGDITIKTGTVVGGSGAAGNVTLIAGNSIGGGPGIIILRTFNSATTVANDVVVSNGGIILQKTNGICAYSGSVTINQAQGTIQVIDSTLAGYGSGTLTINNQFIAANSLIMLTIQTYAGPGIPVLSLLIVSSNQAVITVNNAHGTNAMSGGLLIGFTVM